MKKIAIILVALVLLPVIIVMFSVFYHEVKLQAFSKQLKTAAQTHGVEEFLLESFVSADTGSGPFCSYTAKIEAPLRFERQVRLVANSPFLPAEPSLYPKVDVTIQKGPENVSVTIYDGGHRPLLDYRCL